MPREHRLNERPAPEFVPTWNPGDISEEAQVELMEELWELSNDITRAYRARDERLLALGHSGALSRPDMATATGLNKSRVDQIIREMAEEDRRRKDAAAPKRVRRHMAG